MLAFGLLCRPPALTIAHFLSHLLTNTRKPEDTAQCVNNVALLLDPKTSPVLVDQDDPRKCNIVGVLATTSVPDTALLNAARAAGVWLLSPDGSELRLLNPSEEFEQERGST